MLNENRQEIILHSGKKWLISQLHGKSEQEPVI